METRNNLSVTFYLKAARNIEYIYCLINLKGKQWQFAIHQTIQKEHWDPELKRAFETAPEHQTINMLLDQIRNNVNECYLHLRMKKEAITLSKIKAMISNKSFISFSLIYRKYYDHKSQRLSNATQFKYYHFYEKVKTFILEQYKESDINIDDINRLSFIDNLYEWCRSEKKYSLVHTRKTIGFVKSMINYAVLHEYIDNNKINTYRIQPYGEMKPVKALNIHQLKMIYDMQISNRMLTRVRDLFLFQCFTGLAYVDMVTLTKEHIKKDDQKFWIIKNRAKSGQISTVPLFPQAKAIIEKYVSNIFDTEMAHHGNLFLNPEGLLPCYSNQVFNRALKEIGAYVGLDFQLTTHVARKTFGFIILNGGNISIETVSAMLGHSNIKITQSLYAKVQQEKIGREMKDFDFFTGITAITISA